MKKFAGLVVVLAVLVLGGYYGMGLVTERTLKKDIKLINLSSGVFVDIKEYHRGWFTSKAIFNWRLHVAERVVKGQDGQSTITPAQDYAIDMPLTVYHGPIMFVDSGVKFGLGYAYTDLTVPPAYAAQFSSMFTAESIKPQVDVSILVNYLNKSHLRINVPKFKLIGTEGKGQFEWLGLLNDVTVSSNLSTIDGDLAIDGLRFSKDKTQAEIGKISSEYNLHQTKEGLYLGDASISLSSMMASENEQKIFDLSNLDFHTCSDVDGGLFNSDFKLSLEKVVANGKTYGPGLLKMSINNIDADILAKINAQANKMQQGSEPERQQALLAMLPDLPKLFTQGAKFQISEVSLVMPEGKVEGDLLVALPKGDIGNPFELMQKVEGNGKLKIPAAVVKNMILTSVKQQMSQPSLQQTMVEQMQNTKAEPAATTAVTALPADSKAVEPLATADKAEATTPAATTAPANPADTADTEQQTAQQADLKLSALVQSGLLAKKGDDYVVEFKLAQGQFTVNGQPFNPAMLKF